MRKTLLVGSAVLALCAAPLALSQSFWPRADTISADSAMTIDPSRGVLTMSPLIERVSPAVVSIRTESNPEERELTREEELLEEFFGRRIPRQRGGGGSVGSGVIVDAGNGYILTNHHVVDGQDEIRVTLTDRRELVAKVVGSDDKTDLAVLKVDASNLKDIPFADDDSSKVGDYVVAIGNPFGLGHTVTTGIVSALGREFRRGDGYQDFIQTDASINPGNSGGALVNSAGQLIGINSAIISRSGGNDGIGFSVPVKIARNVMEQIVDNGEVRRGRIGVSIRDITPEFMEAFELPTMQGAFINDVTPDSPAARAGLESGDIVTEFNDETIFDAGDLRNAVGLVQPGTRVDIAYLREGNRRTTQIGIAEFEDDTDENLRSNNRDNNDEDRGSPNVESFSGAEVTDIPEELNLRGGDEGVYVASVRRNSDAARAGLARGDIIRSVGRQQVDNLREFSRALDAQDGAVALTVERDGRTLFIAVR